MNKNNKAYSNKKPLAKIAHLKRSVDQIESYTQQSRLKAVALKYDVEKDRAPKITALGKGKVAEMILKIAEDHRVPFYEDPTLTDLLSKMDINQEIPGPLYTLVAEVLAFVYQLEKLAQKRRGVRRKYAKK